MTPQPDRGAAGTAALAADEPRTSARRVAGIGFGSIAAMAAVGIYAAVELQPLYADGFYYLFRMLEHEAFVIGSPARRVVEWVRQVPVLGAAALGVGNAEALAVLFALVLQGLPIVATLLAWAALPRDRKHFFIFPLVHFFAGTVGGSATSIPEGLFASAYFWVLFFCLMFRANHPRSLDGVVALSVPTVVLHEAMVFLGPILACAAFWRARRESRPGKRRVFFFLAAWFVAVAIAQIFYILHPKHPDMGGRYLGQLASGQWLVDVHGQINVPAAVGVFGLATIGVLFLLQYRRRERWHRPAGYALPALAAAGGALLIYAAASDRMLAMHGQYFARYQSVLVSFPLAVGAFGMVWRPRAFSADFLRRAATICAAMASISAIWHAGVTYQWSRYTGVVRDMLDANRGFVDWKTAVAALPPDRQRLVRRMTQDFIVLPMSILLARDGKVATLLGHANAPGWKPFDALDPQGLPRSRFWDMTPYREALEFDARAKEVR